METVIKEIEVGKESSELVDALADLVEDIKAKKDISQISAENLPGLFKAVEGIEKSAAEVKSRVRNETIAYAGLKIANVVAPDEEAA